MVIQLGKHEVELFDSIELLPIIRFHLYQKSILVDSGIGADLTAFDTRAERAKLFINQDAKEKAIQEIENLRLSVFFIQSGICPKHRAFAALVKRVDKKTYLDINDEAIAEILETLSDVTVEQLDGALASVKKKIEQDIALYFPRMFEAAGEKEYYDLLKKRAATILDAIIAGRENPEAEAEEITIRIVTYIAPKKYAGSDGMEIQYDRQFENLCLMLSEQLHTNPKRMSVLEFYNALEFLQERAKEQAKNARKGRK